jgi:flagellar hook-length control protein FliK
VDAPGPVLQLSENSAASAPLSHSPIQNAADAVSIPIAGLAIEIAARAQAGRNRFEIRLDPPELGRIDVRLDVDRSGQVTSRLVVERADTLEHLRRDAGELQRALQDAGLKTADNSLQFSLRDQGFAGREDRFPRPDVARIVAPQAGLATEQNMQANYDRTAWTRGGIDIRV